MMNDEQVDESSLQQPFLHDEKVLESNNLVNVAQSDGSDVPNEIPSNLRPRIAVMDEYGEDPFYSFIKRIFSQFSLIVMCANTISSVFSISAAVSLIPDDNAAAMYRFCDYGNDNEASSVYVQCPYIPSPVFQTFLSLWCIYFVTYFTYKYYDTSCYMTNDLRFYVYCDKFNSTLVNRIMVGLGVLLTFVSGIGAAQSVVHNGTTDSIGPILVFVLVNIYNLVYMAMCRFKTLSTMDMEKSEAFMRPIEITTEPIWSIYNLNGMLVTHQNLFDHISYALNASLLTNSDKHVAAIGNVAQIRLAMKVLNPLDL